MATGTIPKDQQQDALPFSGLDELNFGYAISGPRISWSIHINKRNRRAKYVSITKHNYLAGHTKKSLRIGAKHITDLKAFVDDLPVELQLLVLEYLHPIDLFHFSQVSRYFRQLVMVPAVLPVWKAAFMRHPDLPRPPPGVKEPQWAFMIFGPAICSACGKYGAEMDFSLQKRFCEPCMGTHTLPLWEFRDESKSQISSHHVIWRLIPYTDRYDHPWYATGTRIASFLKTDFSIMWKKLLLMRILNMNGLSLLSPLYADYVSARKAYILKLRKSAKISNNWADRIFRQLAKEHDDLHYQLAEKCRTRLITLGCDDRDIVLVFRSVRNILFVKAIHRLTRRAFREIKPRIEVLLKKCQVDRIKDERRRLLLQIYRDYLKARSPNEWPHLPDADARTILETKLFQKFLGQPLDECVDISPGSVVPFLPKFIEEWIKAHRETFADILPKDPDETLEARVQRLELVRSVVTCKTCADSSSSARPLVGWKSICRHQLNSKRCRTYVINHHAVAAATCLVSCVGLDPLITTADDMNRRDDRFMCGNCRPGVRHGRLSRRVYTWLECLEHGIANQGDVGHAQPVWLPLSLDVARSVRACEKPYPDPSISVWRCNHCAHHFDKQVLQVHAIDHVKTVHLIKIPAIGVDIVADPRKPILKRREPFRLSLDPAYDHICKHCSDTAPIFKLWVKTILMKHLIKRHRIPEPAEHVDWEAVPMIALPAAPVPT